MDNGKDYNVYEWNQNELKASNREKIVEQFWTNEDFYYYEQKTDENDMDDVWWWPKDNSSKK